MKIYTEREVDLSNQIASFLRARPLISIAQLERTCEIPQGALSKAVKNQEVKISPRHLFSIIRHMADYGIEIDGYKIEADSQSRVIFLSKDVGEAEIKEVDEGTRTYFIYNQPQYRSVAGDLIDLL